MNTSKLNYQLKVIASPDIKEPFYIADVYEKKRLIGSYFADNNPYMNVLAKAFIQGISYVKGDSVQDKKTLVDNFGLFISLGSKTIDKYTVIYKCALFPATKHIKNSISTELTHLYHMVEIYDEGNLIQFYLRTDEFYLLDSLARAFINGIKFAQEYQP